jgi:hypothetical protein
MLFLGQAPERLDHWLASIAKSNPRETIVISLHLMGLAGTATPVTDPLGIGQRPAS